jgi:hypothetical protein
MSEMFSASDLAVMRSGSRDLMPLTGVVYAQGSYQPVAGELRDEWVRGPEKYRGQLRLQPSGNQSGQPPVAGGQATPITVYLGAIPWQENAEPFAVGDEVVLDPGQGVLGISVVWVRGWQHGYTVSRFEAVEHLSQVTP